MKTTVFGSLEIGRVFTFPSNPIVYVKVSDFTAKVICSPCPNYEDEEITVSVIDKRFSTDSIINFDSQMHKDFETIEQGK